VIKVWLVVYLSWPGWGAHHDRSPFHSMESCLEALDKVKIVFPQGADENEWVGAAYCSTNEKVGL